MNQRPLSPHLQIWRWGPHMLVSILHRATGDGLAGSEPGGLAAGDAAGASQRSSEKECKYSKGARRGSGLALRDWSGQVPPRLPLLRTMLTTMVITVSGIT